MFIYIHTYVHISCVLPYKSKYINVTHVKIFSLTFIFSSDFK